MALPVLALKNTSHFFGPVRVLFDIDFDLRRGEVHALIGENGAGKSTTMKILGGYLQPTSGTILLDGEEVTFASSREAEDRGIVMIHQEFNLASQLSVEENIFLGREIKRGPFLDHSAMRDESRRLLERLNCTSNPTARVSDISVPNRQMVEIAKALGRKARVLIMDEPTAVLTAQEARILLDLVAQLRSDGAAILYTSHKLDEVAQIADRITVLRDGRKVIEAPSGISAEAMAEAMVGRELSDLYPPKAVPQEEIVLEVSGLTVPGLVRHASFSLRRGEVLGFAGLVGSGRTELMEGVVGLRPAEGRIEVGGVLLKGGSIMAARKAGLVYLTEDRKDKGLLLGKSLRENLTLLALHRYSRILIDTAAEDVALTRAFDEFDIRTGDRNMNAGNLSGGNQQKLLLAKTMLVEPDIVIIDEPTRGIDIGTKQQIYGFIGALAAAGKSVIVISSELPEVMGISNRVVVMRSGAIVGELAGDDINENAVVRLAMGVASKEMRAS